MLLMQIVREGDDATNGLLQARFHLKTGFKLASTTQALFGIGSFTIGVVPVPAPGALALLGLAGAFGRRRR
jgi:MYXO-CTERM domain-containing protein